jgi:hypothetical protein
MALNTDNVRVALTGGIYVAPTGTTLPTTATASLNAAFKDLGYVGPDGFSITPEDETFDYKAWQNGVSVRSGISGTKFTFGFTLLETTKLGLEVYFKGASVTGVHASGTGPAAMEVESSLPDRRAYVLHVVDGTTEIRYVLPIAEVTERGEIIHQNGEPVGYPLTLTAFPDTNGNSFYYYNSALNGLPAA